MLQIILMPSSAADVCLSIVMKWYVSDFNHAAHYSRIIIIFITKFNFTSDNNLF